MNFPTLLTRVQEIAAQASSMAEGMMAVLDTCEQLHPHAGWKHFRCLAYDDVPQLNEWLCGVLSAETPPDTLAGVWFGLSNPVRDTTAVADMHVCGTESFDLTGLTNTWATTPKWSPDSWAESVVLARVYAAAYQHTGLGVIAEYAVCLAYAALAVSALLENSALRHALVLGSPVGIAVGFDAGDWLVLGVASGDHWQRGVAPRDR